MKILFLSNWFPYPPNNGSKIRIYNLLMGLANHHEITLISFTNTQNDEPPPELEKCCKKICVVSEKPYNPKSLHSLMGLFSLKPRVLVDKHVPELSRLIKREIDSREYDLIIASQWDMAAYCENHSTIPMIFEEVEIGVFKDKKEQASNPIYRLRHALTLLKLKYYLRKLLPKFIICTVASEIERELLKEIVPGYDAVEIIPNCVDLSNYCIKPQQKPKPKTLIFTGSFSFSENYDAMEWFLCEVYPLIQSQVPEVQLTITGDHANLPLPPATNVHLTGYVDDIHSHIASSWVSLAPIQRGGGTRFKILEAMALRTPVVATSKGAEGLEVHHNENILIGDTPKAFANSIIDLIKKPELRQYLTDNAFELVSKKYDWQIVLPRFIGIVENVIKTNKINDMTIT